MDKDYYSDKTIDKFIKEKLCDNNPTLYSYYLKNDGPKFRKNLPSTQKYQKTLKQVVSTIVTDAIRDLILDIIGQLAVFLKPMGDLIISGGEAFNTYFDKEDRIITSDIDTKFVPHFVDSRGKVISPRTPTFFKYLQVTKLLLWNKLGALAKKYQEKLYDRIRQIVEKSKIGKLLKIKVPPMSKNEKNPWVISRRYSLLKKKRANFSKTKPSPENVLIDVELFALDMNLKYYSPEDGYDVYNIGGILDIAFMRPGELGHNIINSRERGLTYRNPLTGKFTYNKNILIASPKFLVEDLFLMKSLELRPNKVRKDRERLTSFAKKVLKVPNIKHTASTIELYKKSIKKINELKSYNTQPRPPLTQAHIKKAQAINPSQYKNYTTPTNATNLLRNYINYSNTPKSKFIKTSGEYRFNLKTQKWVKNTNQGYIKNERKYRLNKSPKDFYIDPPTFNFKEVLYGYNPARNKGSNKLFHKAAMIPFTRPFLEIKKMPPPSAWVPHNKKKNGTWNGLLKINIKE